MEHAPSVHEGDRFESAMRMWFDAMGFRARLESLGSCMVQQQERISVTKCMHW
jgi:hypothetical protein